MAASTRTPTPAPSGPGLISRAAEALALAATGIAAWRAAHRVAQTQAVAERAAAASAASDVAHAQAARGLATDQRNGAPARGRTAVEQRADQRMGGQNAGRGESNDPDGQHDGDERHGLGGALGKVKDEVDNVQRSHGPLAFIVGVWRKYSDDNGGKLSAQLTYYGFLSLFPLLLVMTTVLGWVLQDRPDVQDSVRTSAFAQFPVVGDQLSQNIGSLHGSFVALAIGIVGAIWGGLGVAQAAQDVLDDVWAVPRRARKSFPKRLLHGLLLLVLMGAFIVSTATLTSLGTALASWGWFARIGLIVAATVIDVIWFAMAFKILASADITFKQALPGSVMAAIGWQLLMGFGSLLVQHQLKGASQTYGFFGYVLGLLGFLALASQLLVYSAEVNAVKAKRLWPRSLSGEPTRADKRSLAGRARTQEVRDDQRVRTRFDEEQQAS